MREADIKACVNERECTPVGMQTDEFCSSRAPPPCGNFYSSFEHFLAEKQTQGCLILFKKKDDRTPVIQ